MITVQNMTMGRQEAFEIFKRDYAGNDELEEQKRFLKKSYVEAKTLGESINTSRNKLSMIKLTIHIETFVSFLVFFLMKNNNNNKTDTLKSKCEHLYSQLEASGGGSSTSDERRMREYESSRKTMELEKEKYELSNNCVSTVNC